MPAETTDKLLVFATNGRFYTLAVDKLPGGRGYGEPLRLMIDLPNDQDLVSLFVMKQGRRQLLASSADGRGFVVCRRRGRGPDQERQAGLEPLQRRRGRDGLVPVEGDMVAVVGENRKLLLFPI